MVKGALIQIQGRLGIETYLNKEGQPVGSITCHVNKLTIYSLKGSERTENTPFQKQNITAADSAPEEPLPF